MRDHENPEVQGRNREPSHAVLNAFPSIEAALVPRFPARAAKAATKKANKYRQGLNTADGTDWSFCYVDTVDKVTPLLTVYFAPNL